MIRDTRQRRAIRDVLDKAGRPLSPQEILDLAAKLVPGLGIATVYRTIKALADDGFIQPVDLPGEPTRYEIAGRDHHHYFRCRQCDRVFEIDGCPGNLQALLPRGFQLDGHEVVLYGKCATCSKAG